MGVEAVLFVIVGIVAIVCAAMMLMSENAVHSALFLIVNFICVAFFYIMLEAPFLAMVQIAVYAGAIMVLFLFVIMLLGAERTPQGSSVRRFNWLPGVGVILSLAFLGAVALGLLLGNTGTESATTENAFLRVVNASVVAADIPDDDPVQRAVAERNFDIFLNGEVIEEGVEPEAATAYQSVAPGEYTLTVSPFGTAIESAATTINVEAGESVTAIITTDAEGQLLVDSISDDLTPVERRSGRITVYNAYTEPVSLVSIESEAFDDSRRVTPVVMDIPVGEAVAPIAVREGRVNYTVIPAGAEEEVRANLDPDDILYRIEDLQIQRDTAQLMVVSASRLSDGTVYPMVIRGGELLSSARSAFGSPEAIGEVLFIEYLLPFQLVAVLLLAAMVGVIVLTQREEHQPKPSRALRRKVSRPLTSVISSQTGSDLTDAPRLPSQVDEQPEPAGD
jgi:NADH:ubiquinone oxidoreductase subunit 6 (subunit J)